MLNGLTSQRSPRRDPSEASRVARDSSLDSRRNALHGANPLRVTPKAILGTRVSSFGTTDRALTALALLLTALLLARAGRPWVEFGPPQRVVAINPKLGVHTRLTDEVEPRKVQRTLAMVREMGASWTVEYFLWAAHEPARGVFDWSHADLVVDHAVNQGIAVIGRLGYAPEWARPPKT